jgi:hypothetical protein
MSNLDAIEVRENAKDIAAYLDEVTMARTLSRIRDILEQGAVE